MQPRETNPFPEPPAAPAAGAGQGSNGTPKAAAADALATSAGHTPVHPKRGTGIWMLAYAALLAIGLAIGFFVVNQRRTAAESDLHNEASQAADAPMTVDVVKVENGTGDRLIPLPGECRAWDETTLYARVSGYVAKWFVDIGDHVKQGDVLATIETPELDQQLASQQAKVDSCKAQVNLADANVHFSEVTLARFKDAPKGIVSDLERDEKEADYQTSQAKLTAAQSDLHSAQSEVDRLRAMIAFQKVIAPFDGVITQRHVDIGDLVTSGSTANTTSLFTLAKSDEMRVFVNVPESATPDIREGAEAVATADEFPGRKFVGHVARTSRSINDASKTLRVEVDIPNQDATLLPGMFVRVNFEVKGTQALVVIPASAINFRSGGPQVATVGPNGHVMFHDVVIAHDFGDVIELTSGITPGDRVVLNVSYQVADGDVVKPNDVVLPDSPNNTPRQVEATPSDEAKPVSLNAPRAP